jgi:hypothetical protein
VVLSSLILFLQCANTHKTVVSNFPGEVSGIYRKIKSDILGHSGFQLSAVPVQMVSGPSSNPAAPTDRNARGADAAAGGHLQEGVQGGYSN